MRFSVQFMVGIFCAALPGLEAGAAPHAVVLLPAIPGGYFFDGAAVDVSHILPPPPAEDSLMARAELETVLQVQASRTESQVEWARLIDADNLFNNARVLGEWFSQENLPSTAAFFSRVDADVSAVKTKTVYPRRRPPFEDSRVKPCVRVSDTGSYPSGHSLRAWVWAGLLTEIFPDHAAELAERARAVGWGRVIGGTHYPSDTIAGEQLAKALVGRLLQQPAVRAEIEKCRAEAQPFLLKKAA